MIIDVALCVVITCNIGVIISSIHYGRRTQRAIERIRIANEWSATPGPLGHPAPTATSTTNRTSATRQTRGVDSSTWKAWGSAGQWHTASTNGAADREDVA
jgi:hypothetical protein